MNTFLVKDCLLFGWKTFTKRPWFFVGTFAFYALIQVFLSVVQEQLPGIVSFLLSMIASTLLYIGLITIYLKAYVDPASPRFSDFWRPALFWKYLAASILLAVIVLGGLVLLIIPGIFFALALAFTGYLVVDKGMGPVAALKESAHLTKGYRWKLLQLGIVLVILTILGALPLFLGLLVIGPVSMLAGVYAYETLKKAPAPIVETSTEAPASSPEASA